MCNKKPGPRCAPHLSSKIEALDKKIIKLISRHKDAEHTTRLAYGKLHNTALTKKAQEDLYDAGNTHPSATELSEQKAKVQEREREVVRVLQDKEEALAAELKKAKVQQKDLNYRFLGTDAGQNAAQDKINELHMSGRTLKARELEKEAKSAQEAHDASLEYAKWTEQVEKGQIPGRMVESKNTSASRLVAHSGDPLYDATALDLSMLSNEDIKAVKSGRYGAFAMTPATHQKMSDEERRRQRIATGEDAEFVEAEERSRKKSPEAWKTVKDTSYGDNYLSTVWSRSPYDEESSVLLMHNTIATSNAKVRDPESGALSPMSYPEAMMKALSKREVSTPTATGRNAIPMLTLDDGREVIVSKEIFHALRFNKATG